MVIIQSEIEVEVTAELSVDVVSRKAGRAGVQISSGTLIGKRETIPCGRKLCARKETNAGKVTENSRRAGTSQNAWPKRIEGRLDPDLHVAVKGRPPNLGSMLERD